MHAPREGCAMNLPKFPKLMEPLERLDLVLWALVVCMAVGAATILTGLGLALWSLAGQLS